MATDHRARMPVRGARRMERGDRWFGCDCAKRKHRVGHPRAHVGLVGAQDAMLRALEHVTAVQENSDVRLWIEFAADARHEHYIAAAGGASSCIGVVALRD